MSFVQPVAFRAELSRPGIMDFIARTPAELYFMVIENNGTEVYGLALREDLLEYLTNEFSVRSLDIITLAQVKTASSAAGCRRAGNESFLDL